MSTSAWEHVVDELYDMGGYGEFPHPNRDISPGIDEDTDLSVRTGLDVEELKEIAQRLDSSGLVHADTKSITEAQEGPYFNTTHYGVGLTEDGFSLAHDRRAEKRNHESNQSIIILTIVLAFVGLSQATALTIQSGSTFALGVLAGAAIVLLAVYIRLYQKGIIDF